jgi:hypothetical protein
LNNYKRTTNAGLCAEIPYPTCIPDTTYGITQFWAEEYWAWCQVQKIRSQFPHIDFRGLINSLFENQFESLLNNPPHGGILDTKSYEDVPKNSWRISNKRLSLATSHAPSRYKAQFLLKQYKGQFRILTFDAHLDLGNYKGIHGAWLTENLAKRTALIGGWDEPHNELESGSTVIPYICPDLEQLGEERGFVDWINKKKLYISIDLDFLSLEKEYLGLSCYWHRNLFIGHALNINQRIQMLSDNIDLSIPTLIGKEIEVFEDLSSFMEYKVKSINLHIQKLVKIFKEISTLLEDCASSLLGMDLVEYSAISDWKQLTISALLKNFDHFEEILKPVYNYK